MRGEAAVGDDGRTRDEGRLVGGQKEHGARDLVGLADAADRMGLGVDAPQLIGAVSPEDLRGARVDEALGTRS